MSDPFVAEIRIVGFNFPPKGWALCNGQLIPISQNTALFSLLGTTYGGDGKSTFALPDLQGRAPLHPGQGPGLSDRVLGEQGGSQAVSLLSSEVPAHTHAAGASSQPGGSNSPQAGIWAKTEALGAEQAHYAPAAPTEPMSGDAISPSGGGQPHNNMPPYLVLNFCIAMQGIFPPRS